MAENRCNITLFATDKPPKLEVIYDTPISVTVWINSEPLNNHGELAKTRVIADYIRFIQNMRVVSCSIDQKIPPHVLDVYINAARSTFLAYKHEDNSVDVLPRSCNQNAKKTQPRLISDDEKFIITSKISGRSGVSYAAAQNTSAHSEKLPVNTSPYFDEKDTDTIVDIIAVKLMEHKMTPPVFDCKTEKQWRKLRNFVRANCGILVRDKAQLRLVANSLGSMTKGASPPRSATHIV